MKDIDDMRIGESFYLKRTVAVISTRNGRPCEFDEERIDINDLIIEELEKIKEEIEQDAFKDVNGSKFIFVKRVNQIIDKYKAELKGSD